MDEFAADRGGLSGAVSLVAKVAPRKTSIPALNYMKVSVNGGVRLTATDLENWLDVEIAREGGKGNFDLFLPTQAMSALFKVKGEGQAWFEKKGLDALVDGPNRVVGMDPADWPAMPDADFKPAASAAAGDVLRALKAASFAVSTEVVRYALTGILLEFEVKGKKASGNFVSSDGKRIVFASFKAKAKSDARFILNTTAADLLASICRRAGPEATLSIGVKTEKDAASRLLFSCGDARLWTRPIDGHFPDWRCVVPADQSFGPAPFEVSREALQAAIRKVAPFCNKSAAVKFSFGPSSLKVFAKDADKGHMEATIPCTGNDSRDVFFNHKYLLDYLASLPKTATVRVSVDRKEFATKWSSPGLEDVYVLMPLTVNF